MLDGDKYHRRNEIKVYRDTLGQGRYFRQGGQRRLLQQSNICIMSCRSPVDTGRKAFRAEGTAKQRPWNQSAPGCSVAGTEWRRAWIEWVDRVGPCRHGSGFFSGWDGKLLEGFEQGSEIIGLIYDRTVQGWEEQSSRRWLWWPRQDAMGLRPWYRQWRRWEVIRV